MANEKRLILRSFAEQHFKVLTKRYQGSFTGDAFERAAKEIAEMPGVDAVEVVHGCWEDAYGGQFANPRYRCSVCKEKAMYKPGIDVLGGYIEVQALTPFCPNCGALLDLKGETNEG